MEYNAFKAHKIDVMKVVLRSNSTKLIMIPLGCALKCQLVDIWLHKPFKGVLRNCWSCKTKKYTSNY